MNTIVTGTMAIGIVVMRITVTKIITAESHVKAPVTRKGKATLVVITKESSWIPAFVILLALVLTTANTILARPWARKCADYLE